jgi:hypothetical protein
MMEIWIRSIARAGGVETPATVRILDEAPRQEKQSVRPALAALLKRLGRGLVRTGNLISQEADPVLRCG